MLPYSNSSLIVKSIFSTVNLLTVCSHALNDMVASLTINPLSLATLNAFNVWKVPGLIEHMFLIAVMAENQTVLLMLSSSDWKRELGLGMLNIMLVAHRPHGLDSHCSPFLALWCVYLCQTLKFAVQVNRTWMSAQLYCCVDGQAFNLWRHFDQGLWVYDGGIKTQLTWGLWMMMMFKEFSLLLLWSVEQFPIHPLVQIFFLDL